MNENEKTRLLVLIAKLYYEHNLSQQEVAERVNLSRTYVGKLLTEAKDRGIVAIKIFDLMTAETEMEEQLRRKFGLHKVIIIPEEDSDPNLTERIGEVAANYFSSIVQDNDVIGVSWGATMHAFAKYVKPRNDLKKVHVVQLCGGISKIEKNIYTSEIPQSIATALNSSCHLIPLPAVLNSVTAKNSVMKDPSVSRVMKIAHQVTIAVFTVSTFDEFSTFVRANYFTKEEIQELKEKGAVGDFCSHIIDMKGQICDPQIDKRCVALPYDEIINIPIRIGIAANMHKFKCVKTALKYRCINVFVTNEQMARSLLLN